MTLDAKIGPVNWELRMQWRTPPEASFHDSVHFWSASLMKNAVLLFACRNRSSAPRRNSPPNPEMLSSDCTPELPTPFDRSYWARPGQLLAGCYPGDLDPSAANQKLKGLIQCGVSTVINLMEANETGHSGEPFIDYVPRLQDWAQSNEASISCLRFPIRDLSVPSVAEMRQILDVIDDALAQNKTVYVHCWGGRGRTGTVIACHLLRHRLVSEGEALAALEALTEHKRRVFWPTPESSSQREFVKRWKWDQ